MILRAIIIIEQFKLLEVVEPGGSKYGINDGKVTRTVVAPTDGESRDRALVASQSAEDGGHIHSHCTAIDPGLEIERCRAPERAPPPREHLCAGGILAREDGDDADEDIVREAAYQVFSSSKYQFWVDGFLIQPPLLGPRHHTHLLTTSGLFANQQNSGTQISNLCAELIWIRRRT
jgi:hypothetical protein